MKRLSGQAEGVSHASASDVAHLLRAVDEYPSWGTDLVREVVVLERDDAGYPQTLQATLRVPIGPIPMSFHLTLAVSAELPDCVKLTRLPNDPDDEETFVALWRLDENQTPGTTIRLDIEADLDVPRFVPIGDIGDKLAKGFLDAAAAAADAVTG